jgi:hypothetical protein
MSRARERGTRDIHTINIRSYFTKISKRSEEEAERRRTKTTSQQMIEKKGRGKKINRTYEAPNVSEISNFSL